MFDNKSFDSYIGGTINYRNYPIKKPKIPPLTVTIHTYTIRRIEVIKGKVIGKVAKQQSNDTYRILYTSDTGDKSKLREITIMQAPMIALLSGSSMRHSAGGYVHEFFNLTSK